MTPCMAHLLYLTRSHSLIGFVISDIMCYTGCVYTLPMIFDMRHCHGLDLILALRHLSISADLVARSQYKVSSKRIRARELTLSFKIL